MTPTLEVRDLDVLFGPAASFDRRFTADRPLDEPPGYRVGLPGVSFSVESGDCLAVLGASGSGKSSLLRALAGLQVVRTGTVRVKGRDVTALPPERRSVVYLHQEPVLFPHRSVIENVMFPLIVRGVPKATALPMALEWLQRLQVQHVAGNMPEALSGGQRHRVALARALCADPAVLLLDEPLASLDPGVRADVRDALLAARAASGAAVLLVTHDLEDALAVGTHIMTLGTFGVSALGTADAMLQSPPSLATARLLGVYAEVPGVVRGSGAGALFRWAGGEIPAPGAESGDVVACVRAHEVQLRVASPDDRDALTVLERRDGPHESVLTLALRGLTDTPVRLRASPGAAARVGDHVTVTLSTLRLLPPVGAHHV